MASPAGDGEKFVLAQPNFHPLKQLFHDIAAEEAGRVQNLALSVIH